MGTDAVPATVRSGVRIPDFTYPSTRYVMIMREGFAGDPVTNAQISPLYLWFRLMSFVDKRVAFCARVRLCRR